MITHTVLCALKPDHDTAELAAVMHGLNELEVDGFLAFTHGANIDAEGKTPRYGYGFVCSFSDRAALDRYAANPDHRALGGRLVALCQGGGDGVLVSDICDDSQSGGAREGQS